MAEKKQKQDQDQPAPRFAPYDTTRLKYVAGVFGSEQDARDAAKAAGVDSPEIREV